MRFSASLAVVALLGGVADALVPLARRGARRGGARAPRAVGGAPDFAEVVALTETAALPEAMGATLQPAPLVAFVSIFASFAWLRTRVDAYNAAADDWDAASVVLRDAKVQQLTSGTASDDNAAAVASAAAELDAAAAAMQRARSVAVGTFNVRLRVPSRGPDAGKTKAAVPDAPQEMPQLQQIVVLTVMVVSLLPLLALMSADPMSAPSPALQQAFQALDTASPSDLARGL
ncbi:hypothetical protein M885DRAFT_526055 [Pelagophyceae sp. CCMP2097]|nr:hypothetical protein M885DRAFT_526055 [Pelagophyceae sp. CCMP2097]